MEKDGKLKTYCLERDHPRVEVIYDQADRLKEYINRIEMNELTVNEILYLNKKREAQLDESNSLVLDYFIISPNPSNGLFMLDMGPEAKGDLEIQVFDVNGRSVYMNQLEGDGDIVLE